MPRHPSRQGSGRLTPALQIRRIAARLPSGSSPAPAPRLCSRPGRRAEADRPPDAPGPVTRPSRQVYRPRALADRPGVEALHKLRGGVPGLLCGPPALRPRQSALSFSRVCRGRARPARLVKLLRAHVKRHFTTRTGGSSRPHGRNHPGLGLHRGVGPGPQAGSHPRSMAVAAWPPPPRPAPRR